MNVDCCVCGKTSSAFTSKFDFKKEGWIKVIYEYPNEGKRVGYCCDICIISAMPQLPDAAAY